MSDPDSMREFVEANGVSAFPHLDDQSGSVWDRFGVIEQRTYAFVNDDGSFRLGGYGSLEQDVEQLLAD